jgi:ankyrin repeat protein
LRVGARFGFPKLVRLELEMGANINLTSGPDGQTPLIWAAKAGHLDTVKLLLEYGANPLIASKSGLTPLMYAAANGHLEIVELLASRGVNSYLTQNSERNAPSTSSAAQTLTQELSLDMVFSAPCQSCGTFEMGYQVNITK